MKKIRLTLDRAVDTITIERPDGTRTMDRDGRDRLDARAWALDQDETVLYTEINEDGDECFWEDYE